MFFKKKVKFRLAAYLLAASIILTQVNIQSVFALQSNSPQNKMANIDGYRIIASNKVEILVDKPPQVADPNGTQFKLYEGVGTSGKQISIISAVNSTDTPNQTMTATIKAGYRMQTGGDYLLTAGTNFNPGTTYTIVLNNTLAGGTYFPLGHTNSNKDVSISFTCPDTLNSGSNANSIYNSSVVPTLNFNIGNNAGNVSLEGNVWFTVSVPVSNYDEVKNGLVLKKDGIPVSYAPFSTVSTVANSYDCYPPVYNDDHTFFGFLLTQGTGTYYDFNWKPKSIYTLSVPDIKTINGQTIPAQTLTWNTMNGDVPNKLTGSITASVTSANNVQINWSADVAGPISGENNGWPAADGYNVYVSTDPYWNFVKLNSDMIPQPANSTVNTVVSYTSSTSGLIPNTKYYVRIAPLAKSSDGSLYLEGGMFTLAGSISTGAVTLPNSVSFTTSAATAVNVSGNASVSLPLSSTTENYTAAVKDQYGYTMDSEKVTWSLQSPVTGVSIDPATGVVTVDNTAVGGSSFTVVAADGSLTGSKTVNVVVPVSSVAVSKTTDDLVVGGTDQLTAAVAPNNATNKNVTWKSDNTAVATVSDTGLVTAVSAGIANITVTTEDGSKTAACVVTVTVSVNGVSLNKTSDTLTVGDTDQLTAAIDPVDATNQTVTWASDNTAAAAVSDTGLVTAVGAGTANITATTADGSKTAACAVTVTVPVSRVSLNKTSDTLAVGDTDQLTAAIAPADATNQTVTWASDNTAVAVVSDTGSVTALSAGTANITVTTADGSKTAVCVVTVNPAAPSTPAETAASFTDNSTGITVKGDMPAGASKILVEALDEQSKITDLDTSLSSAASETETYKTVAAYDLSLLNGSNVKIQPDGTISVSIPLDESIANKNLVVFYVDGNGVAAKMASAVANGVITFTTTHFSQYVIAEVVPVTSTDNSGTNSTANNTSGTNAVSTAVGTTTGGNTTSSANTNGGTAASTTSTASGSTTANTDGSTETTTAAGTSSGTNAGTVTTATNKDSNAANLKTGSYGKFILPIVIAGIVALAGLVLVGIRRRKRLN